MRRMQTIGIFGGSFDPPTLGHLEVIKQALSVFDRVSVSPAYVPIHGKSYWLDYAKRRELTCRMVHVELQQHGFNVGVGDEERVMYELYGEPVSTYSLLNWYQRMFPRSLVGFICGDDVYRNIDRFKDSERLKARYPIFAADGSYRLDDEREVRSTFVRNCIDSHCDDWLAMTSPSIQNSLQQLIG